MAQSYSELRKELRFSFCSSVAVGKIASKLCVVVLSKQLFVEGYEIHLKLNFCITRHALLSHRRSALCKVLFLDSRVPR